MQPLTSPFAESRKGCSDPTLSATRLRMLEPRHVTEERGKHTQEQGECLQLKTMPGTSALKLFLKHTAVASTGPHKDISFVSFCCFSPSCSCLQRCPGFAGLRAPCPKGEAVEDACLQEAQGHLAASLNKQGYFAVSKRCV